MPYDVENIYNNNTVKPPVFDPEKQRDRLKKFELTKEQENELLLALWNIARMMAEMGQGVEQTQTILYSIFKKAGYDSDKLVKKEDDR